jgi:hypothetical protein
MGPKRILTAEQRARKPEVQKATRALKKAGTEYYIQPQHCNDKEHKQPSKHYCAKGKPLDVCKVEHAPTEKDPIRIGAIRSCNPCYLVKERERQMKPEIVAKKLEYAARPEVKERERQRSQIHGSGPPYKLQKEHENNPDFVAYFPLSEMYPGHKGSYPLKALRRIIHPLDLGPIEKSLITVRPRLLRIKEKAGRPLLLHPLQPIYL